MNLHKVILACSSEYFDKLFSFGTEKFQHQITINVNDVDVTHDIILSFYGQNINSVDYPHWKYLLESIKCRCFFCLPNDISLLYDLIVPAEDFDLLLEIIEQGSIASLVFASVTRHSLRESQGLRERQGEVDAIASNFSRSTCSSGVKVEYFDFMNDGKIMRTIKKNIPMNYDLRKLSLKFVKELSKYQNLKIVSGSGDKSIKIWDADTGSLLNTLNGHTDLVESIAFSSDNRKIVSGSCDNSIKIWDADSGSL